MPETGTLLQNRYLIIRELARGGMGAVYEATDLKAGVAVAVKESLCSSRGADLRKAFEREARLLKHLEHPALAAVTDYFLEGEGQFLVMEFIAGRDLSQLMEDRYNNGFGPFPLEQVLQWADQLLDALDYLHAQQPPIIHRDIKPQNLKPTPRGQLMLLDFGLAKGATTQMSQPGDSVRGHTPHYAPLEQISGAGTNNRSDLYSVAATLHHLLTLHLPPDAMARASDIVMGNPDPLKSVTTLNRQVPTEIASVIYRALSQNPESRPKTAAEMRAALQQIRHSLETVLIDEQLRRQALAEERRRQELARQRELEAQQQQAEDEKKRQAETRQRELVAQQQRAEEARQAEAERQRREEAARQRTLEKQRQEVEPLPRPTPAPSPAPAPIPPTRSRRLAVAGAVLLVALLGYGTWSALQKPQGSAVGFTVDLGNAVKLEMVNLPGGEFTMGSNDYDSEKRPHPVKVNRFAIGKYEVTQAQWKSLMNNNPRGFNWSDELPVEQVSWNDAQEFLKRLRSKTGDQTWRLPTEAEWEYAARAGSTGKYSFGDAESELHNYAWFGDNSDYQMQAHQTHPVGGLRPNAFGLFDIHGNVWEWCEDLWHKNYDGAPPDGSAWLSGGDSSYRVLRGGSWLNDSWYCRSAYRDNNTPGNRVNSFGLRVVFGSRTQ